MEKEPLLILQQSLSGLRPMSKWPTSQGKLDGNRPWQQPGWPQKTDIAKMAKEWDTFIMKGYAKMQIQVFRENLLKENAKRAAATKYQQILEKHIVRTMVSADMNKYRNFNSPLLQEVRSGLRHVSTERISTMKQNAIQLPWQQVGWPSEANSRKMAAQWDNFLSNIKTSQEPAKESKAIKILPEETKLLKEKMAKRAAIWRKLLFPEIIIERAI